MELTGVAVNIKDLSRRLGRDGEGSPERGMWKNTSELVIQKKGRKAIETK